MGKLKEFRATLAEELKKDAEQNPIPKEKALNLVRWAVLVGAVVWGAVAVAAAIMLVGFGAWPWVIWPLALYWWTHHLARSLTLYNRARKGNPKWEQNVTFNVTSDLTAEQIAEAARKAARTEVYYGLTKQS